MRAGTNNLRTAADLVNEGEPEELERIFWEYGEERQSRRIVRALVERRKVSGLASVRQTMRPARPGKAVSAARIMASPRRRLRSV